MSVMIGIDPHKGSHTAVVIDSDEVVIEEIRVRASAKQVGELQEWAAGYEDRCWAVESARGLGYLLSQQLVAAGERVLDVPAMLASRVRVLGSGKSVEDNKALPRYRNGELTPYCLRQTYPSTSCVA